MEQREKFPILESEHREFIAIFGLQAQTSDWEHSAVCGNSVKNLSFSKVQYWMETIFPTTLSQTNKSSVTFVKFLFA